VTTLGRAPRAGLAAEAALAFAAGAATFWFAGAALAGLHSDPVVALLGAAFVVVLIAVARTLGVAYAVPVGMAGILAYDWFYVAPTHAYEFPDAANLVELIIYVGAGVLIGQVGADAVRRAKRSEGARTAIAAEQAALRRVATLVARGVPASDVFAAVAAESGQLLGVHSTHMARFDADGGAIGVSSWSPSGTHMRPGRRIPLDDTSVTGLVLRSGHPARVDDYEGASADVAAMTGAMNIRSSVGAPIVVESELWGAIVASSGGDRSLPEDTESRLLEFTELVATAISNTEARAEVQYLADEQAALRRVATLVAEDIPPADLFTAVAEEVGRLLGTPLAGVAHYETHDTVTALAIWVEGQQASAHPLVPGPWPLDGGDLASAISRTGTAVRVDDYDGVPGPIAAFVRDELGVGSSVGTPIVVEGRLWGVLYVHSNEAEPLPPDTEPRLANFAGLVATALSNAQARAEADRLADEQASLRRVATLVARGSPAAEVFAAVADEVGQLLQIKDTALLRYEADGTATVVVNQVAGAVLTPVGTRVRLEGQNVATLVLETGRSVRQDYHDAEPTDTLGGYVNSLGFHSGVGSPIVVEGRLWGVMVAVTRRSDALPARAEARLEEFTALIGTAVSNVQARSDLAASRARIVAAADDERRRVVRDLHDGAQQALVHTIVTLKLAERAAQHDGEVPVALVSEALSEAEHANAALRELSHGMLPSILTRGGLRAGVEALAGRMALPVEVSVSTDRLAPAIEATAYFVVSEALTNVAKHSGATRAEVAVEVEDGNLRLRVNDNGVGGARPDGSGLVGLADRLAVLGGRLNVESPLGGGTVVAASIPLSAQLAELRR
jgi:signal transduction histidine kinase